MDWSSKDGATKLCLVITDYWRSYGVTVAVWLEPLDVTDMTPRFVIKSSLVRGLPVDAGERARFLAACQAGQTARIESV